MCINNIEYNNSKCHSRTLYTKSMLIASGNVFLRVDYVLFQCLFSSNMELGFKDCPIFFYSQDSFPPFNNANKTNW